MKKLIISMATLFVMGSLFFVVYFLTENSVFGLIANSMLLICNMLFLINILVKRGK